MHRRNQNEEYEQKSLSSQRPFGKLRAGLVRRVRRTSLNYIKFKTLAFAPQAKQFFSSRASRLLFKFSSSLNPSQPLSCEGL